MLAPTRTASTWTATKPHANLPQPTLVEHGRAHELDAKKILSVVNGRFFLVEKRLFFEVGPSRSARTVTDWTECLQQKNIGTNIESAM